MDGYRYEGHTDSWIYEGPHYGTCDECGEKHILIDENGWCLRCFLHEPLLETNVDEELLKGL